MNRIYGNRYGFPVAILLLAFALRLVWLDTRPLWYDDAFSVLLSERGLAAIASGTAADTMPPGYYVLLYAWIKLFGESPFAMRMLSVALSMLVVVFVYSIAARGFGERAGRSAAFFAALMPFQIYHAQELRMYTLLAAGGCIFLYGVLRLAFPDRMAPGRAKNMPDGGTENPLRLPVQWRALALVALGTALALFAHNLAFATLVAANLYFLYRRAWGKQLRLLGAQFLGALLFSPWLLYVPTQLEKIQSAFWTQQPAIVEVIQMILVFITYLPLPPWLIAVALFASVLVVVLVVWGLLKLKRREVLPALSLMIFFVLVPPVVLFVLSYSMRPVFVPRGAIVSSCAFVILSGTVVAYASKPVRFGVGAAVLALALMLLPFYYTVYGEWRRAPFAQASAFLRAQTRAGDVVLHDNKLSFLPMHLYDRALAQVFLADPPGSDNDTLAPASRAAMDLSPLDMDAALNGKARVWFVIFQTAIDEAQGNHPNLAQLEARFQRIQELHYGDLDLFLFAAR